MTRLVQDLHASVATARRALPALHTELLPPIDCDDSVYFKLDAAGQRVHALLDLCAAEFAESGRSGCGWEGIIDHAKGRLMRAQVPVFHCVMILPAITSIVSAVHWHGRRGLPACTFACVHFQIFIICVRSMV